jgi:hypothetical protein
MQGIFWLGQGFQASEEVFCSIQFVNILSSYLWVYCLCWGLGIRNQFPAGPEIFLFTLIWNLVGGNIFCTPQNQSQSPPSLLDGGYWVSLPGVKWPERDTVCLLLSSAKVKEIWKLYLSCPTGSSWAILGRTLHFLHLWQKKMTRTRTVCKLGLSWSNQAFEEIKWRFKINADITVSFT